MKKSARNNFIIAGICLLLFLILTVLVSCVDVQPIGPGGSEIGLASLNDNLYEEGAYNPTWDKICDVLGIVSILTAFGFAVLGVWQWITRKSLKKVDVDLFVLAGTYVVTGLIYVLFEIVTVNYRPILVDGALEGSYPSSHTILVCVIMLTAIAQMGQRIRNTPLRIVLTVVAGLVMAVTAIGRLLAGVHWYTDVIAAILLSGALAFGYKGTVRQLKAK